MRRAVITGVGIVAANGIGRAAFWQTIQRGESGIRPIHSFDVSPYEVQMAGEVPDFPAHEEPGLDKASQFLLVAGREALTEAAFRHGDVEPPRAAVVVGTTQGGLRTGMDLLVQTASPRDKGPSLKSKICEYPPAAPARHLARLGNCQGPCLTASVACASGTAAVGMASDLIHWDRADVVLAGGVDTLNEFVFSGFHVLRALTPGLCRPFDARRDGLVLGEGAAVLVVEERARARARGACVYGEVAGWGGYADGVHATAPDREGRGAALSLETALREAGITPEEIDYVNAHGTGTRYNDAMEAVALQRVFGKALERLPVSSTKPFTGHAMGASGALEAVVCLLALRDGFFPPTLNYEVPDPECPLDVVALPGRNVEINLVLSMSSAFAGNNAVVVFRRETG